MEEMTNTPDRAWPAAGMDRTTARKYAGPGGAVGWGRRGRGAARGPFAKDWEEVEALLVGAPELEARDFRVLIEKFRAQPGHRPARP